PYGRGLAEAALASARAGGWLTPDALIMVEEAASAGFAAPAGFDELERRRYDDTTVIVLRHRGSGTALIFARAARLAGAGPARDLAADELDETLRRPALRRRAGRADALEPLAHGRCFHRLVDGLGEAPHDLVRRSLRKRERTPAAAVEAGKAQLLR